MWAPDGSVRFLADTVVVERWSDAKGAKVLPDGHGKTEAPAVGIEAQRRSPAPMPMP
jgi:hypothetical protein